MKPSLGTRKTAGGARLRGSRIGALAIGMLLVPLLAGCSLLGGSKRDPATIYAPDPRVAADPAWPTVDWQLSLSPPTAARVIDSFRIAVRPAAGEMQVYKGASWAKTPTDMVQDVVLRALEDSGRIQAVARQGTGINADYKLVMDMRRFEADYAGQALPSATIELNAKLVHAIDQDVVASRTFLHAEPAAGTDIGAVADAFSRSLASVGGEVAGWVLATGNTHEHDAHPAGK
jgi:cholesterol transport system auxiliary component